MGNYVYFYAVDPGAVSVMKAIVASSPDNVKCHWIAEGYAKSLFDSKRIEYFDTNNIEKIFNARGVMVFGSQINYKKTAELINHSLEQGIKTIFIFDHWCNYRDHFTLPNGSFALPTRIFVMDEYVNEKLVNFGVDPSKICIIGHPGIEFEVNKVKEIASRRKQGIREKIGAALKDKIILLALEPLSEDFPAKTLDYDEYSIALLVHQVIREMEVENLQLVVRLHPRQSFSKFHKFLQSKNIHQEVILYPRELSLAESLSITDMVIGMYSVFLIKALILGKPTISLQFNPKIDYEKIPPLERIKINEPSELGHIIAEKLSKEPNEKIYFPTDCNKKAWDEIRMLLSDESN